MLGNKHASGPSGSALRPLKAKSGPGFIHQSWVTDVKWAGCALPEVPHPRAATASHKSLVAISTVTVDIEGLNPSSNQGLLKGH